MTEEEKSGTVIGTSRMRVSKSLGNFKIEKQTPCNVLTSSDRGESQNTSSFVPRVLSERSNGGRGLDELVAQAGDLSLAQQKATGTVEEAFKSHVEKQGRKVEEQIIQDNAESMITSVSHFEGVERDSSEQLRNEEEDRSVGDYQSRSKGSNISSRPSELYSSVSQSSSDEYHKAVMERLQNASYIEIEDMMNDPTFADGPNIWVKDRRNVYRKLGGEAAAVREQKRKTLCELCKGISIESGLYKKGHPHAKDKAALEDSAKNCPLCHLLTYMTISLTVNDNIEDKQITVQIRYGGLTDYVKDECPHLFPTVPEYGDSVLRSAIIPLNTEIGDPAILGDIPPIRNISNSGSPEAMRLVMYWLERCLSEHCCQRLINTPLLSPWLSQRAARLLDVSSFDDSEDVRVVETASMAPMPQYLAVSHVWGPSGIPKHTKLLTSNFEQLLTRIPYGNLAASFRDAVKVTRMLGFRYVWIDALCIVQDSDKDWRSESTKMASVYTHAILTIAIDGSKDSNGGCFRPINLDKSLPRAIRLETRLSNGMPTTLIIPEIVDATQGGDFDTGPKALKQSPLSTRAWAFQERVLSPRIIHFTDDVLIWECRKEYQSHWNLLSRLTSNGVIYDTAKKTLIDRWYLEIVPEYSGRNLTFDTDKLPALAGLARLFYELLKLPYVAGIWIDADDIGTVLSWKPVCPNPFNWDETWRQKNKSGCPWWSWASMACGATYQGCVANEKTCDGKKGPLGKPELIDYGCLFQSHDTGAFINAWYSDGGWWDSSYSLPIDPFGQIKNAWLKIKGWVREATIVDHADAPRRGWRNLHAKDGTEIGAMTLDVGIHGGGDILLFCLYDEGSFVNALVLYEIKLSAEYARLGLAHVKSDTGTKIEEWELRTVILG